MNKMIPTIALACLVAGCAPRTCNSVVKETYIHKYGVPVTPSDWKAQGQEGNVVRLHKDGVTVTTSYHMGVIHGEVTSTYPHSSTVHYCDQYAHGEQISRRAYTVNGAPSWEEFFLGGELTKRVSWYEEGSPRTIENYEMGLLITGEYRSPLNISESYIQAGEGTRVVRSPQGMLLSRNSFEEGLMVEQTIYYPNGDPREISQFENEEIHGTRRTFFQGGIPDRVEQWLRGQQTGLSIVYLNGERAAEIPYLNGKKHGTERRYRDGTQLVEEICWHHDVQHGQHKVYVDDGIHTDWYHQGKVVSRPTFERMNGAATTR